MIALIRHYTSFTGSWNPIMLYQAWQKARHPITGQDRAYANGCPARHSLQGQPVTSTIGPNNPPAQPGRTRTIVFSCSISQRNTNARGQGLHHPLGQDIKAVCIMHLTCCKILKILCMVAMSGANALKPLGQPDSEQRPSKRHMPCGYSRRSMNS